MNEKIGLDTISAIFLMWLVFLEIPNLFTFTLYLIITLFYLAAQIFLSLWRHVQLVGSLLVTMGLLWLIVAGFSLLFFLLPFAAAGCLYALDIPRLRYQFGLFAACLLPAFFAKDHLATMGYALVTGLVFLCTHYFLELQQLRQIRAEETIRLEGSLYQLARKHETMERGFLTQIHLLRLEERNQLSHKIHDQLGHSLTGGLLQLEAAKTLLQTDPQKAGQLLDNAIKISQEGIEQIRLTLKETKPEQESLALDRLKFQLEEFEQKASKRTMLQISGNLSRITQEIWYVISQNLTEGLTNILKYSEATNVQIGLEVFNQFIRFEIKDNGIGVRKLEKSLGLIGIEERTAALGGQTTFNHRTGFAIVMIFPIKHENFTVKK
ncbi:sensor histidine kinase [Listeria costaricensis]|uniref:sensor histidine kinase n=1 Tax=Listeria costaricensis TaxID=2026604 RepID=UPI000C077411|nr:histidine kinase [Listeria costaricensis]